ncbi:MAG: TIGR02099 family protein [Azoarcus sp.]|jgi:uncharacterized protein (TIGR02099 family)|nr:TIGR02099 family protein [Azoarcus sp.]
MVAGTPDSSPPSANSPARKRLKKSFSKRFVRILMWFSLACCVLSGLLYAVTFFWLFPWLSENREWVAEKISGVTGGPATIERLDVDWAGIRPRLRLAGLTIRSGEHEALRLERVNAMLSWRSVLYWMPYFHTLEIITPEINLERGNDGVLTVAGIRMEPSETPSEVNPVAWLLGQSRVVIRDGTLIWDDALRGAPPLHLTEVQFRLERGSFNRHFELSARPPEGLAGKLEVNGDIKQYDPAALEQTLGKMSLRLDGADLGGWSAWVDYPFPCKGRGEMHVWLDSDGEGAASLSADIDLENVETTLGENLVPLKFSRLAGRILAGRALGKVSFGVRGLWLISDEIKLKSPIDFNVELRHNPDETPAGGAFSASVLNLGTIHRLAGSLPLDEEMRARLDAFDPKGILQDVSVTWGIDNGALKKWSATAHLKDIVLTAHDLFPGVGNLSGTLVGNEESGIFSFSIHDGHIDLPKVFERSKMPFASLEANGGWGTQNGRPVVDLKTVQFSSSEAEGTASGQYWIDEEGPGEISITGNLTRAQVVAIWRFFPFVAGPHVREWAKGAFVQGVANGVSVEIKGPMHYFPFRDGEHGKFRVVIPAKEATLQFAQDWPPLEELGGTVTIDGAKLTFDANEARIMGVKVKPYLLIPDLGKAVLNIDGAANGATAEFLRFLDASPLERVRDITKQFRAEGDGHLDLKLVIPLKELEQTMVSGQYGFADNRVRLDWASPAMESASGSVAFTKDGLESLSVQGRFLGGACTLEGKPGHDGAFELNASGQATAKGISEAFSSPVMDWFAGETPWKAEMGFRHDSGKITVRSGLKGLRSRLPAPFSKDADETWLLDVVSASRPGQPWHTTVKLAGWLEAAFSHNASGNLRGGIGLNRPVPKPSGQSKGLQIDARFDDLDIDAWQWTLSADDDGNSSQEEIPLWSGITLESRRVRAFGYAFHDLKMRATSGDEGWKALLESAEAHGVISWQRAGNGMLSAHLGRLSLSSDDAPGTPSANNGNNASPPKRGLPGLDVRADEFALGTRELGQLEVQATNLDNAWRLDKFTIQHPHATFSGSGLWRPTEQSSTLDFILEATDIGQVAATMGYDKIVQGEDAKLSGKLEWHGALTQIDFPTLSGSIKVNARKGRFERIEPGMGRLLGVLSLQALPRRVTLDFKDIFSGGFAFDRINGKATVAGGIMQTDKDGIEIVGPAAQITIKGEANVVAETQDLLVNVRPALSESVAIGVTIINPVAGAVSYLMQKATNNPVGRLFSSDYKITGSWADPTVEVMRETTVPINDDDGVQNMLRRNQ